MGCRPLLQVLVNFLVQRYEVEVRQQRQQGSCQTHHRHLRPGKIQWLKLMVRNVGNFVGTKNAKLCILGNVCSKTYPAGSTAIHWPVYLGVPPLSQKWLAPTDSHVAMAWYIMQTDKHPVTVWTLELTKQATERGLFVGSSIFRNGRPPGLRTHDSSQQMGHKTGK